MSRSRWQIGGLSTLRKDHTEDYGWTTEEAAKKLGVSRPTISRWRAKAEGKGVPAPAIQGSGRSHPYVWFKDERVLKEWHELLRLEGIAGRAGSQKLLEVAPEQSKPKRRRSAPSRAQTTKDRLKLIEAAKAQKKRRR